MLKTPFHGDFVKNMKYILTNDDGINAPGIKALKKALDERGITIAPLKHHSGCGHKVTTHRPLNVEMRSLTEYAVEGTPADCSRIGLSQIASDADWLISGINEGGNLGVDIFISGTVAAAREAAILGYKSIAISHWIKRPLEIDWDQAAVFAKYALNEVMKRRIEIGSYWNINLPHLEKGSDIPEIIYCKASIDPLPVSYKKEESGYIYTGVYPERKRTAGTDVDVCFSGKIAATLLKL